MSSFRLALGLFSYYKKFVNHFSTLASPLNKLFQKAEQWVLGKEQEGAFMHLKEEHCSATVLKLPYHYKPYILTSGRTDDGLES